MENNISKPVSGLHTDNSYEFQPKNTYPFALNAVKSTKDGDNNDISNEESNTECYSLTEGFIPIGSVYIGNKETCVFLVNESETLSEIGVIDSDCNYIPHVRANLSFKVSNQVDAIYRLRRGCEKTIYFTDNLNKPRIINLSNVLNFKIKNTGQVDYNDIDKYWDINKFDLVKISAKSPVIDNIKIEENGSLKAGSYNFLIQYLDEDLNPTEWLSPTETIIIFNDKYSSRPFSEIRGSTNKINDYQDYGKTNKSISLSLENLDDSYTYYRIAVVEATDGSGNISDIYYSVTIPIQIKTFNYSVNEGFTKGTIEELKAFQTVVEKAKHINQIDNILKLSNTQEKNVNWCNLQRFASSIKTDLVTKEVVLNNINVENNQKRGEVIYEGVGYMPGEIYSFGIVYFFSDGTISPVYHIPGSSADAITQMSKNNTLSNTVYTSDDCFNFWANDERGNILKNTNVRHHRFPFRHEVGKPLIVKSGNSSNTVLNGLFINISGAFLPQFANSIVTYLVTYEINSVTYQKELQVNTSSYNILTGIQDILVTSNSAPISFISLEEIDVETQLPNGFFTGLQYQESIRQVSTSTSVNNTVEYKSEIFGIKFSNIIKPDINETGGYEITKYAIVRNERTENKKTILDYGVMTPILKETGNTTGEVRFLSHGHLAPNSSLIAPDIHALIHPEHKFLKKEYTSFSNIIEVGNYIAGTKSLGQETLDDVQSGTTYDASIHKRRERDTDGYSLHVLSRNTELNYSANSALNVKEYDVKEVFYLDSLYNKSVVDTSNNQVDVFNTSADNRIGIVQLNENLVAQNRYPYVAITRDLQNPYNDFRYLPYYLETKNFIIFPESGISEVSIYNGDSFISPMKYTSSMFYDIRASNFKRKKGILNYVVGFLSTVAGAILAVTGIGTPAGIALIGFGISQIATGIKKSQISKVYGDLYAEGLNETVQDLDTVPVFSPNPPDDTIQWFFDTLSDIWIESSVNMNWRLGNTIGLTDFMNPLTGYNQQNIVQYCIDKVTIPDVENNDGRTYQGFAKAEIYEINKDYTRRNKEKVYFNTDETLECCSECIEKFPHRIHYSLQSFQEEKTDNYRIFLPNNYIDINGETGEITDVFTIQNNIYVLTSEALWHLPQSFQERVTSDIVSFIGTGSYFSIPPRKIVDDENGNSAGTKHKQSVLKTPYGVFFVCENQNKIYQFDGNSLKPISSNGMEKWFKKNIPILNDLNYYRDNKKVYPYADNPSNKIGTGFISTYDSENERVLFSKKDHIFKNEDIINSKDYIISYCGGNVGIFKDYNNLILNRKTEGWNLDSIEDCRFKFKKPNVSTLEITREITTTFSNTLDIVIYYDLSGSFTSGARAVIKNAINEWLTDFRVLNPDWVGNLYHFEDTYEDGENWLRCLEDVLTTNNLNGQGFNYLNANLSSLDIAIVTFTNESRGTYYGQRMQSLVEPPFPPYFEDDAQFKLRYSQVRTFYGINYPIVYIDEIAGPDTRAFMQHVLAAMKGRPYTQSEVDAIPINYGFIPFPYEWNFMKNTLLLYNPYPIDGLENYNWKVVTTKVWDGSSPVITKQDFQNDIGGFLTGLSTTTTETITVETVTYDYEYENFTDIEPIDIQDNSWTISYDLKENVWLSYHSYMPNMYIHMPETFYSWKYGNSTFWKHNIRSLYQKYYDKKEPFIVEVVSNSNPITNRVWDYIQYISKAYRYDENLNSLILDNSTTFTNVLMYNSKQSSGVLDVIVKDNFSKDYFLNQIKNQNDTIVVDNNEGIWSFNKLRDIVVDYNSPLFIQDIESLSKEKYYTNKIINTSVIDHNKKWSELQNFRDNYLVIRFIFNTFEDIKLLFKFSIENESNSHR